MHLKAFGKNRTSPTLLSVLFAGLLAVGLPSHADDASGLGDRKDEVVQLQRINKAMSEGDLPALADIYKTSSDPVVHVIAAAVIERMHWNLDASNKAAQACEDQLAEQRPAFAFYCGRLQSGNLRLAGRYRESEAKELSLVQRFTGRGFDKELQSMKAFVATDSTHPLSVEMSAPSAHIDLIDSEYDPRPHFKAQANGHKIDMMFDSGANNIALDEATAHDLGVDILPGTVHFNGWLTNDAEGKHGLLKELKVGPVTWRNVPVLIVPSQHSLIGINMLAPLGSLRVSKHSLVIGADAVDPSCHAPMLVNSDVWGSAIKLLPPLQIEDEWKTVMLDTGATPYLIGTGKALEEATLLHRTKSGIHDIGGSHEANTRSAKVKITVSGQPIEVYFEAYADSQAPWPITLGSGALRDMDFLMDFSHQHLCFALHPNLH